MTAADKASGAGKTAAHKASGAGATVADKASGAGTTPADEASGAGEAADEASGAGENEPVRFPIQNSEGTTHVGQRRQDNPQGSDIKNLCARRRRNTCVLYSIPDTHIYVCDQELHQT